MASKWSASEDKILLEARSANIPFFKIAIPGRTSNAIWGRYDYLRRKSEGRLRKPKPTPRDSVIKPTIPPYVIAERDRRSQERAAMTLAQILMGEPPPSQSATAQAQGASRNHPQTPCLREAPTLS